MTATPLTVNTTIPIVTVISSSSPVYDDPGMTSPVTVWPATISGDTTWYIRGGRDATALLTVTDATGTVVIVQQLYSAGQVIDVDAFLTPAMVVRLNAAPHTWAAE